MSRTYRKYPVYYSHGNRTYYDREDFEDWTSREYCEFTLGFAYKALYGKKQRDFKVGVPKWFKTMKRRIERAKVKSAMQKKDYDNIPFFRKSDRWDFW